MQNQKGSSIRVESSGRTTEKKAKGVVDRFQFLALSGQRIGFNLRDLKGQTAACLPSDWARDRSPCIVPAWVQSLSLRIRLHR